VIYTVKLEPSGRSFQVTEDDVILDAALAQGIRMPHGCRAGTCKSCRAKVISGIADVGRAFPGPKFMMRLRQFDGYTLMCRATAACDLVIQVDEQPSVPEPAILTAKVKQIVITGDVAILRLQIEGDEAVSYVAGQYVDLLVSATDRRSYSIATPPALTGNAELEFHVRHLPGGLFTDRLFGGDLSVNEVIGLEAPLGAFYMRESSKPAVMLASGTGYAPIRAILLDILPRHQGRRIVLYWGGRQRADLYNFEEVIALERDYPDFSFVPVLSEAGPSSGWAGRTGFVHAAVMQDLPDLSDWQVYACGVPQMVDAAQRDFMQKCSLPENSFFADAFISKNDNANVE
jgi:CDP-4-dehydro-6-deoxyglucose reductase